MGRHGQGAAGRGAGLRHCRRRARTRVPRQGRLLAAPDAGSRRARRRHRPHPARAGRDAAGADRAVALVRRRAGCGDRPLDGRGDRGRGGRRADPGRGIGRHRHPDAADEAAVRTGCDGAAGTRRRRDGEAHRRSARGHHRGLRVAEAVGDRGPAGTGRRTHRRRRCAGQTRPSCRGGRRVAPSDDRPGAAGAAGGAGLPAPGRAEDPVGLDRRLRGFGTAVQRGLLGGQPA